MTKRIPEPARPKRPRDPNRLARQLIQEQTGQAPEVKLQEKKIPAAISRYMAELGRRGGKIGGKSRMTTLTQEQRSQIAYKAAQARWGKRGGKP